MSPGVSSLILWTLVSSAVGQAEAPRETLQSVEAFRGGRHWADAKTAPPKSPEESLKTLQTEPGVTIELFAAEPLVEDPVAIAFDWKGRMFVVEYGDYPIGPPEGEPPLSRIVVLEDEDQDGRADKRTVFADHLKFAHSLLPHGGGIIVGAQTQILFLVDTNEDNVADQRYVLFDGFTPAHPQMQIGNPRLGLDGWIYCNYGPGAIRAENHRGEPVKMPRQEFRFNFDTMEFEPASGLGQFGNTIDSWGNRFFCTNRNPIMTAMFPQNVVNRNPYAVIPKAHYDVGASGGDTRVYPLVDMKSNYLSHAGTHTSACGVTAYRGGLFDKSFRRSVFVCEPIGHLVTRSVIQEDGLQLTAARARPKADFIASSDTWFRPASLATGPDGALYLADMYRLWVEHPKFLPEEIAKKLDWRAGEDRGRIYRIRPTHQPIRKHWNPCFDDVPMLSDPNGWRRMQAHQSLLVAPSNEDIKALQRVLKSWPVPVARLHALWILNGLGLFDRADSEYRVSLIEATKDGDWHIRSTAIQIASGYLKEDAGLTSEVLKLVSDPDVGVRFQVALALGETQSHEATQALSALALRDGHDEWFRKGILTSAAERSGAILVSILGDSEFTESGNSQRIDLIRELATVVGSRGHLAELESLLTTISATAGRTEQVSSWWQTAAMSGLAIGLPRHRGSLGRVSLASLLSKPPQELSECVAGIKGLVDRSQNVALNRKAAVTDREAAIELMSYQSFSLIRDAIAELLRTDQPVAVQSSAIEALRRTGSEGAAELILERWETLSPAIKQSAMSLLWRRTSTIVASLEAMVAGRINRSAVDLDQRIRLLKSSNQDIRSLAVKVFGGAISENRREVAATYRSALTHEASVERGLKVFQRVCSKCHKIDGKGFEVGPDISDVRNRSREALLYDILDPNSKVEPRFADYAIATDDGRVFNGLMISESADAVVLRQPEGKQQVIPRSEIEAIRSSGKSLMPEGVEKEVTVPQMADLLEYLKSRR